MIHEYKNIRTIQTKVGKVFEIEEYGGIVSFDDETNIIKLLKNGALANGIQLTEQFNASTLAFMTLDHEKVNLKVFGYRDLFFIGSGTNTPTSTDTPILTHSNIKTIFTKTGDIFETAEFGGIVEHDTDYGIMRLIKVNRSKVTDSLLEATQFNVDNISSLIIDYTNDTPAEVDDIFRVIDGVETTQSTGGVGIAEPTDAISAIKLYADEAAARSAGLRTGQQYYTADSVVRAVLPPEDYIIPVNESAAVLFTIGSTSLTSITF